jgi:hypothetical protein
VSGPSQPDEPEEPTRQGRLWGWSAQWGNLFGTAAAVALISIVLALVWSPWFWLGVAFGVGAFIALLVLYRRTGPPPTPPSAGE